MPENTLVMPKLGLTMTEGTLAEWKVSPGQSFAAGDTLLVIETEKIANDVEAINAGVMISHLVAAGETVPVGTAIARWSGGTTNALSSTVAIPAKQTLIPSEPPSQSRLDTHAPSQESKGDRVIATPLARKRAAEQGVDLNTVVGSGPRGRVKAADVQAAATETAVRTAKGAPLYSCLVTVLDAGPLKTLRDKISSMPGAQDAALCDLVALAAARVLETMPELNRVWSTDGARGLLEVNVRILGNRGAKFVCNAGRMRFMEFVRSATLAPCEAAVGVEVSDKSYLSAPSRGASSGLSLSVSISSLDGGSPHCALVSSYDARLFDGSSIERFTDKFKGYLERPLRILLD
jgi:hypothetical protein